LTFGQIAFEKIAARLNGDRSNEPEQLNLVSKSVGPFLDPKIVVRCNLLNKTEQNCNFPFLNTKFEILFKKFRSMINLARFFFSNLRSKVKKTVSKSSNGRVSNYLAKEGHLRITNFKIKSIWCIKLAPGAKFSVS
jgi:6-pyruvoyl-tetrahydropterin synthase